MNTENAEILALQGLGWLAGEEDGLQRFLDLSGLDAALCAPGRNSGHECRNSGLPPGA